ncbi:MAG: FkbM family methyltransferase [Flavobacteriia bacterium]|jgi:FkbM family methyltransferase
MKKNTFINQILRFIYNNFTSLKIKTLNKIRVSGKVKIVFEDLQFYLFSKFDDGIVDTLYFKDRTYSEVNELRLFKAFSKKSQTVLDIGANTGIFTIVSKMSNPNISIHSFEPYPINSKRLLKNLEINKLNTEVTVAKVALGAKSDTISFAVPEKDQVCDALSADVEFTNKFYRKWINFKTIEVPQVSLDEYCSSEKIAAIDLIKIDVENYELEVFKGARKTLEKYSPLILVEIFVDDEKIAFYENYLKPLGYTCFVILNDGIVNLDGEMIVNPDCRNFILTKKKITKKYLSFKNMDEIVETFLN